MSFKESKFEKPPEIKPEGEEIKEIVEEEKDYGEEIFGIIQKEMESYYLKKEAYLNQEARGQGDSNYYQKNLKKIKENQEAVVERIKVIKNFKQENPEIYKEFLERVKKFSIVGENYSKLSDKAYEAGLNEFRTTQRDIDKELTHFFILESLVKIETMNPPKEIKEIVEKELNKNRWIESSYIKDFIDTNPSKEEIKVLERLNELNVGDLSDFSQRDLIEKKDKIYQVLLNDKKFPSFANQFNQLKEICNREPTIFLLEDARAITEGETEGLFSKETQSILEKLPTPEIKKMLKSEKVKQFIKKELKHYEIYQEIMRTVWIKPPKLLEEFLKKRLKKLIVFMKSTEMNFLTLRK